MGSTLLRNKVENKSKISNDVAHTLPCDSRYSSMNNKRTTTDYQDIAKRAFILSAESECVCVPTPEYAEHERREQEVMNAIDSPSERLFALLNMPTFGELYPDKKLLERECLRCALIMFFDEIVPERELSEWTSDYCSPPHKTRVVEGYREFE